MMRSNKSRVGTALACPRCPMGTLAIGERGQAKAVPTLPQREEGGRVL